MLFKPDRFLLTAVGLTLLALVASGGLALSGQGLPLAVAHLAFAAGVLPLILAAIGHFLPVLTRSAAPALAIRVLPFFAQGAGWLAFAVFQFGWPRAWLHGVAGLDLLLLAVMIRWVMGRAEACLGPAHPGWRWYAAALGCAALALLLVPPLTAIPTLYGPLRLAHLHLNVLGLVGLAALGTLPVLFPTALGVVDAQAGAWLKTRLGPALGGVLMIALGAAFFPPLAGLGALLWAALVFSLLRQWLVQWGGARLVGDGVTAPLLAAGLGLIGFVLAGIGHGLGLWPARPAIAAWAVGFLLPLVSGALSQLLPVWIWPGPVRPARLALRQRLARGGGVRAVACLLGGLLLLGDAPLGWALAGVAGLSFLADLGPALVWIAKGCPDSPGCSK